MGLTQQELADKAGMRKGDISRLETGKTMWHAGHLLRVAEALSVPDFWIVGLDPDDETGPAAIWRAVLSIEPSMRPTALRLLESLAAPGRRVAESPPPPVRRGRRRKVPAPH